MGAHAFVPASEAMPSRVDFKADLASALEDSRAIREQIRFRQAVLTWSKEELQAIPSLAAIALNSKVMCIVAEVFCSNMFKVKAPRIGWIRAEAGWCFIKKGL